MSPESVTSNYRSLVIAHIGAGRYDFDSRNHVTFSIWKRLSEGSKRYEVFARSMSKGGTFTDKELHVSLIRSIFRREFEFLFTQFLFLPSILRSRPDVIVSQSPVIGGLVACLASKILKVPHMTELHGDEFLASNGGRTLRSAALRLIARPIYRQSSAIRVLSATMKAQLAKELGSRLEDRLVIIEPRVDRSVFQRKTDWRIDGALRVVMVGAVNSNKGQVRAISSLQNSGLDVEILIIGSGPDEHLCKRFVKNGDRRVGIRLLGQLPPEQVASLLRESDVFLMNSLSEGTPRALVEAMAVGLPVISSTAGFCSDLVEDGVTGFLIPRDDNSSQLRAALIRLRNDGDLRARMGTAAATVAAKRWDSEIGFGRYRKHIWQLAASNRP